MIRKILVLAANPKGTSPRSLDREVREIGEGLKRSRHREQFELVSRWAVRPRDIQRAMLDENPQIVHFAGHGKGEEGLVFEDEIGQVKLIDGQALARLFDLFSNQVECVILNGCYSQTQAVSISQYIDNVIGMSASIGDSAAIEFAIGFYDALGAGRTVDFAYKFGCNAIQLAGITEHLTPIILQKSSANSVTTKNISENNVSASDKPQALEIFISYAREDEEIRNTLSKHLKLLERQQVIQAWYDGDISAGTEWASAISEHVQTANIILLLISADFMASDYCYSIELERAIERHEAGEALVIPIILRPTDWLDSPFGKLQALPSDAKPITTWENLDEAFLNVVQGIRRICEEIVRQKQVKKIISRSDSGISNFPNLEYSAQEFQKIFKLGEVFKYSGVPTVTFVEPEDFHLLQLALEQPGIGIVIEGPSGIGKTTAITKAISDTELETKGVQIKKLSARRPKDISSIETIQQWHKNGIAVIDDFHRLNGDIQNSLVDYFKYLADNELSQKLVIIGIPSTGKRLVNLSFDVATRVEVFKINKVEEEVILEMIKKGEKTLNIIFDRKTDIASAALGSLNMAQFLCYHSLARKGFKETQRGTPEIIAVELEVVIAKIMNNTLSAKFEDTVRCFASFGDYQDRTCIEILRELSRSHEGIIQLKHLQDTRPELSAGITEFLTNKHINYLYKQYPDSKHFLLYDERLCALIIDDPQLFFYLANLSVSQLVAFAGKAPI